MEKKSLTEKVDISSKLLILTTLLFVTGVGAAGIYYQDTPLMWFADGSTFFTALRAAMAVLLIALFVSNPPRSILFRTALMTGALVLGGVAAHQFVTYSMHYLDMAMCIQVGIILAIEALEFKQDAQIHYDVGAKKIPVTAL